MTASFILGLWPIAGITTMGVTNQDAHATIQAAIEGGIKSFDTAFSYGYDGESDRLLGEAIAGRRDQFVILGKVGQRWTTEKKRIVDGSPSQLIADAEQSLGRLGIEHFDTLFLHSPDPAVDLEESAAAIEKLRRRGLCERVGVCNVDSQQLHRFTQGSPCHAVQCPLNILQPESLSQFIPTATELGCDVYCFWTLMKGLLAGAISRDHVFAPGDSRPHYEIFQGKARERAHVLVDGLKQIGQETNRSVAELAIGWVLAQPGVSGALVGARYPDQIRQMASASSLEPQWVEAIDQLRSMSDES